MEPSDEGRSKRLRQLIKTLKMKEKQFAEETGINPGYLSNMLNRHRPVSESKVSQIIKRYSEVNRDWILYAKGDMFLQLNTPIAEEPSVPYVRKGKWEELEERVERQEARIRELDERLAKLEGKK